MRKKKKKKSLRRIASESGRASRRARAPPGNIRKFSGECSRRFGSPGFVLFPSPSCGESEPCCGRSLRAEQRLLDAVHYCDETRRVSVGLLYTLVRWKENGRWAWFYTLNSKLPLVSGVVCVFCVVYSRGARALINNTRAGGGSVVSRDCTRSVCTAGAVS